VIGVDEGVSVREEGKNGVLCRAVEPVTLGQNERRASFCVGERKSRVS
jgi:hypothetical protein